MKRPLSAPWQVVLLLFCLAWSVGCNGGSDNNNEVVGGLFALTETCTGLGIGEDCIGTPGQLVGGDWVQDEPDAVGDVFEFNPTQTGPEVVPPLVETSKRK